VLDYGEAPEEILTLFDRPARFVHEMLSASLQCAMEVSTRFNLTKLAHSQLNQLWIGGRPIPSQLSDPRSS
jgi:hypothetical protein